MTDEQETTNDGLRDWAAEMRRSREQAKGAVGGLCLLVRFALDNRCCSTAEIIRSLLLSLYNGSSHKCDLAAMQQFDTVQRRALAALLLGMGLDGGIYDYEIRDAFALAGQLDGLAWFLKPLRPSKEMLRSCLAGAQRNGRLLAALTSERQVAA